MTMYITMYTAQPVMGGETAFCLLYVMVLCVCECVWCVCVCSPHTHTQLRSSSSAVIHTTCLELFLSLYLMTYHSSNNNVLQQTLTGIDKIPSRFQQVWDNKNLLLEIWSDISMLWIIGVCLQPIRYIGTATHIKHMSEDGHCQGACVLYISLWRWHHVLHVVIKDT